MKAQKKSLLISLIVVAFIFLFIPAVQSEAKPNTREFEIKDNEENEAININLDNPQEFQPMELDLNYIKLKPFPVRLRDSLNSNLATFFNSYKGDYGQKFILEFRLDL